jgi:hypothetical protein
MLRNVDSDTEAPQKTGVFVSGASTPLYRQEAILEREAGLEIGPHHSGWLGRRATAVKIRRLIEGIVAANPLWRAPRIHGELKMLGIEISERTVSRILRTLRRQLTQTWKTSVAFLTELCARSARQDFPNRIHKVTKTERLPNEALDSRIQQCDRRLLVVRACHDDSYVRSETLGFFEDLAT